MTKRYDEYKDSGVEWLGEIPSHWGVKKLKNIIKTSLKYGAQLSGGIEQDYYRYIRITDITIEGKLKQNLVKKYLSKSEGNDYELLKGDLLFARSGATTGKTFLFDSDEKAAYAGYLIKASFNDLKVCPKFVYYYTDSNAYNNWKSFIFEKSTIENIGGDKYRELILNIPEFLEQQAIATYLDNKTSKIDSALAELTKQKDLLIELKKSTIHQAVTKGLDLTVPMKDSGVEWIGEVPKHWGMTTFKNKLIKNNGGCWGELSEENIPNAIMAVRSTEQTLDGKWNIKNPAYIIPEGDVSRFYLKPGDLLLTKSSGSLSHIGKTTLVENMTFSNNTVYSNFMQRLRFDTNINPKLMHYFINSNAFKEQVSFFGTTTTGLININAALINAFYMPFFSKEEQSEIVSYLDKRTGQIDQSIEVIDKQIAQMKEYKKTLINDVVTGKIKVID